MSATAGSLPRRIAIFTGAHTGNHPAYAEVATELATYLAGSGIGVVYGGGRVGLMGVVANAAMAAGGEVIGVIPQGLFDAEVGHHEITTLEVVPDMHTRKARMAELSDAFVALPGGIGTMEEFFEVWTWQQLAIHSKPVGLFDVCTDQGSFWAPLVAAIERMRTDGFVGPARVDSLIVETDPTRLVQRIASWQQPPGRWS